ncbi:MAG: hypothetical protein JEZ05_10055 [Tenericutes bacterium]|nr:hypothetical protein [Mycoplasmatota bacterium]
MKIKKYILMIILIFIAGLVLSKDYFEFRSNGSSYYILNTDYIYSKDIYNLSYYIEYDNMSDENILISSDFDFSIKSISFLNESDFQVDLTIKNKGTFKEGEVLYLYSFEENSSDYTIKLETSKPSPYIGYINSEGPYNNSEFNFSVIFRGITLEEFSNGCTIIFENMVLTLYERK